VDILFQRRLYYGELKRSDAGRPSVEGNHPEDSKNISEGSEKFSAVLQKVTRGTGRKRDQGVSASSPEGKEGIRGNIPVLL
jgi:hypothetical protein